jgi:GT2 family glycosyltransferase
VLGRLLGDLLGSRRLPPPVDAGGKLSVGMAAYGGARVTAAALECLLASLTGDFELILVDDNSPDETLQVFEAARRRHATTQLFHFPENREYGGSLNTVLSHATREHVVFLSNDVLATPAYFRGLLACAVRSPDHGIVRGVSNFCDDHLPVHNVPTPAACEHDRGQLFRFAEALAAREGAGTAADDFLTGDAFMVTRAVLERVGTIDTRFFGYFADIDFGVRARIAGFRQVTALGAFAYHCHDANFRDLDPEAYARKRARRYERLQADWGRFSEKWSEAIQPGSRFARAGDLPWDALCAAEYNRGRHFVPPGRYEAFRVPPPC